MDRETIDKIVWWIPFRKTRDTVRNFLNNMIDKTIIKKFKEEGTKVLNGPFKGLSYILESHGSHLYSKLLGSYEEQIYGWIDDIEKKNYDLILDIGCAEGYYAVGFAYKGYAKKIIGYDTEEKAIKLAKYLASSNILKSELILENRVCTHDEITELSKNKKLLVFCDIEGDEKTLLDLSLCPELKNIDIIVESHDFEIPDLTELLISRFQESHSIDVIEDCDRDSKKYKFLNNFSDDMSNIILDEGRKTLEGVPVVMKWLRLISKS